MVAAYCLDPGRSSYGLKDLAGDHLGEKMTRFEELFGNSKKFDISEVAIDQVASYAGADAEVVFRLVELFKEKMATDSVATHLFEKIEMPLVDVIESMETAGIAIDVSYLKSVGQKFEAEKARIEKEKTSFTDETVKGGELYTYFLNSIEKDGLKIIGEKTVTVPIDYLIDGDTFPAEIKNANRIFVPKKVILKSNGKNLSWNANEIFIDDTFTIDTTPPYKRLLPGEDGQSCSTIDIKARKVVGDLNVECRPQDGADGADGMNGKHGEPGKKGQPGDVELKPSNEWKSPLNDWQIANMKNWYISGQLPTGTKPDRFSWELWFKCSKAPTKGGDGENGENGMDGGAGGKGGNNSKMTFEIDEPIGFSVGSSTKAGAAGLGGRGGNGGKAGVGGPPGDPDPSGFLCPVSTEFGKTGVDGHNGREGKAGLNGQKWVTKWIYKGGGTCGGFWK
jgi:hypothetical protein